MLLSWSSETTSSIEIHCDYLCSRWLAFSDELTRASVQTHNLKWLEAAWVYARAARGDSAARERILRIEEEEAVKRSIEIYTDIILEKYVYIREIKLTAENKFELAEKEIRRQYLFYLGRFPKLDELAKIMGAAEEVLSELDRKKIISMVACRAERGL